MWERAEEVCAGWSSWRKVSDVMCDKRMTILEKGAEAKGSPKEDQKSSSEGVHKGCRG